MKSNHEVTIGELDEEIGYYVRVDKVSDRMGGPRELVGVVHTKTVQQATLVAEDLLTGWHSFGEGSGGAYIFRIGFRSDE